MSKKLLASLMAGAMLISQATSLDVAAKSNLREFGAENKNFIEGVLAGGLGTVLVGTIAYLVHDYTAHNYKVVPFDYKIMCLNTVSQILNEGNAVQVNLGKTAYLSFKKMIIDELNLKDLNVTEHLVRTSVESAREFSSSNTNFSCSNTNFNGSYDILNCDCQCLNVTIRLIKNNNKESELEIFIQLNSNNT